jgi:hypothetical protein
MKRLFLIRGIQGSGKSTLAKLLIQEPTFLQNLAHTGAQATGFAVSADEYFSVQSSRAALEGDKTYNFDASLLSVAHQWCQSVCDKAMKSDEDYTDLIVVHNTFAQQWMIDPYLKLAQLNEYTVQIITCHGNFKNVHGVPDDAIQKTKDIWQTNVTAKLT